MIKMWWGFFEKNRRIEIPTCWKSGFTSGVCRPYICSVFNGIQAKLKKQIRKYPDGSMPEQGGIEELRNGGIEESNPHRPPELRQRRQTPNQIKGIRSNRHKNLVLLLSLSVLMQDSLTGCWAAANQLLSNLFSGFKPKLLRSAMSH